MEVDVNLPQAKNVVQPMYRIQCLKKVGCRNTPSISD